MSKDAPRNLDSIEAEIVAEIRALIEAGRPVPEELIDRMRDARLGVVSAQRSRPAREAEECIAERITGLEMELQAIEDGRAESSEALLGAALDLSGRLRWLHWSGVLISGELPQDPLSFVDQDVDWVERAALHLRRWDTRLDRSAAEIESEVEKLRSLILRRMAWRFLDDRDVPGAFTPLDRALNLWLAAGESYRLERDLRQHGEEASEEATDAEAPAAGGEEREVDITRLKAHRGDFLALCAAALEEASLDDRARFCERVASDLLDRSSATLTESAGAGARRKTSALHALRSEIDAFLKLIDGHRRPLLAKGALPEEERRNLRAKLGQLERLRGRTKDAEREEHVYLRLQRVLGTRLVKLCENIVLVMILGFLGLVALDWWIETAIDASDAAGDAVETGRLLVWRHRLHLIDLVLCVFFQIDFFTRWGFAGWRGWYFRRHFFFESLPALPYALLLPFLQSLIIMRLIRFDRFLRLPVLLRSLRVFAFFVRGADRTVERFRGILDRDVVIFHAKGLVEEPESPPQNRLLRLEDRHRRIFQSLYNDLDWPDREPILRRRLAHLEVEARFCSRLGVPYRRGAGSATQEILFEEVIRRCLDCDVARSITYFGREGAQRLARWLRFLDVPVFRSAPVVRRLIPAARLPDPSQAVSQAVRATGQLLEEVLGAIRFWGDVSGITTGPQILDRIASAMIVASRRPAIRLLLFGVLFLILSALAEMYGSGGLLSSAVGNISRFLGTPIIILGSVCLVFFSIGMWFKRISGEALDAHLRTSDAHFYTLIKEWKRQRCAQDVRTLYRSVLLPERKYRLDVVEPPDSFEESRWVRFLADPLAFDPERPARQPEVGDRWRPFLADREMVLLYYRTFLDWPILHRDDAGASVQLLGNLVLNDIRIQTLGLSRRELRRLEKLNLGKIRHLSLGPYFWFRFITESLSIETAKLVIEYNSSCIPTDSVESATPDERRRFESFLEARRPGGPTAYQRRTERSKGLSSHALLTDEFSSLNFLTADDRRDEEVRRRFGEEVLAALRRDRRGLVRDVFGTRPYHALPRPQRVFNPYRLYHRYLGGARFVLLPLVVVLGSLRIAFAAAKQIFQLVDEVLGGKHVLRSQLSRSASFDVAVRKINRMRKPLFMEALKLRARIDLEYLGLRIPGYEFGRKGVTYEDDLDYIGAADSERRPLEEMRRSALNDLRRFRLYLRERGWLDEGFLSFFLELDPGGGLGKSRGEVLRALATAYVNDHQALRTRVTTARLVKEFVETALEKPETWGSRLEFFVFGCLLWFLPRNRRRRRLLDEYCRNADSAEKLPVEARRKLSRVFLAVYPEVERAVAVAVEASRRMESGEDSILEDLRRVARDHKAWTRRVITVRTLQTITVLDIQSYRDLVWKLGAYEEESSEHAAFRLRGTANDRVGAVESGEERAGG